MKVKLLISRAGAGFVQSAGDEIEVTAREAEKLVNAGQAIVAVDDKKETATVKKAEQRQAKK